jgi:hypothetical protein
VDGSQTGARHCSEGLQRFVDGGKVKQVAEHAVRAVDGPKGRDLRRAEDAGGRHSHDEDPELARSSSDWQHSAPD